MQSLFYFNCDYFIFVPRLPLRARPHQHPQRFQQHSLQKQLVALRIDLLQIAPTITVATPLANLQLPLQHSRQPLQLHLLLLLQLLQPLMTELL
jgi:hypothetical protein